MSVSLPFEGVRGRSREGRVLGPATRVSPASSCAGPVCGYASHMDGAQTSAGEPAVAVEILYASGCPQLEDTRARLKAVAEEAGVVIAVGETLIETVEQAQQRRFPGSPTVRVEGRDVAPEAEALELFGLG